MTTRRTEFVAYALDSLKARLGLASDAALAEHLAISPQMLGNVRSGETEPTRDLIITVLDHAGYPITRDAVLSLLPPDAATANQHGQDVNY